MSPEMSEEQRRTVLWRLLEGLSYGEVAAVTGTSATAVAQVWQEFGQGRMPGFKGLRQYAQAMRDLAVDLHRAGIAPGGASLMIQSAQALARTGVEPQKMQDFVSLCERLAGNAAAAHDIVQAALALQQLETTAGMEYKALVASAQELWERVQSAESRLVAAREASEKMEGLGLPASELPAFAAQLEHTAQRHQVTPDQMKARLFAELERLDQGLSLQTMLDSSKTELAHLEEEVNAHRSRLTHLQSDVADSEGLRAARRSELASLDATLKARQAEAGQLETILVTLRQELGGLVEAATRGREQAEQDLRQARDAAATALDGLLGPNREALAQAEQSVLRGQAEAEHLEATLAALRQELAGMVEAATGGRERAESDARRARDDASATLDSLAASKKDTLSRLEDAIARRRAEAAQVEAMLSGLRQEMGGLIEAATAGRQRVESDVRRASDDTAAVLDTLVSSRKDEIARLEQTVASLRTQLGQLVESVTIHKQQVTEEARRAAEAAATALQEGTAELRRELDALRKETLELAGRSARIDADIRSREWLSRLLSLLEGKDDVRPEEVRALTLAIVEPLQGWMNRHREAFGSGAQDGLARFKKALEA